MSEQLLNVISAAGYNIGYSQMKSTKKVKAAHTRLPVLGSQPAGDVNHKPDSRLPLLSARPAVTLATLKKAATNFAAW